ncbi:hypothetical protein [Streptomyces sp. H27-D2]|uniref:hypothetical protein n=1 Tax=Streptomyces sp. H27-D2 TaxID=3046304 RepID=UPI002DB65668|nr:hypothetical protein [Streptomyces sp. H27-D2]MEC4020826.1 hypothetical protein [Streptomyces sp. H27-D2]
MADTEQAEEITPAPEAGARSSADSRAERRAAKLAKEIGAFAKSHGGSAEGQLAHIGRGVIRIALVGANGEWGTLVAPSQGIAQRAAELAGLTLREDFDGELAAKVRTGPYEWSRMAGLQIGGPSND